MKQWHQVIYKFSSRMKHIQDESSLKCVPRLFKFSSPFCRSMNFSSLFFAWRLKLFRHDSVDQVQEITQWNFWIEKTSNGVIALSLTVLIIIRWWWADVNYKKIPCFLDHFGHEIASFKFLCLLITFFCFYHELIKYFWFPHPRMKKSY